MAPPHYNFNLYRSLRNYLNLAGTNPSLEKDPGYHFTFHVGLTSISSVPTFPSASVVDRLLLTKDIRGNLGELARSTTSNGPDESSNFPKPLPAPILDTTVAPYVTTQAPVVNATTQAPVVNVTTQAPVVNVTTEAPIANTTTEGIIGRYVCV